jgi:hypothetical protein
VRHHSRALIFVRLLSQACVLWPSIFRLLAEVGQRASVTSTEATYSLDGDRRPDGPYLEAIAPCCAKGERSLVAAAGFSLTRIIQTEADALIECHPV